MAKKADAENFTPKREHDASCAPVPRKGHLVYGLKRGDLPQTSYPRSATEKRRPNRNRAEERTPGRRTNFFFIIALFEKLPKLIRLGGAADGGPDGVAAEGGAVGGQLGCAAGLRCYPPQPAFFPARNIFRCSSASSQLLVNSFQTSAANLRGRGRPEPGAPTCAAPTRGAQRPPPALSHPASPMVRYDFFGAILSDNSGNLVNLCRFR